MLERMGGRFAPGLFSSPTPITANAANLLPFSLSGLCPCPFAMPPTAPDPGAASPLCCWDGNGNWCAVVVGVGGIDGGSTPALKASSYLRFGVEAIDGVVAASSESGSAGARMDWMRSWDEMVPAGRGVCTRPSCDSPRGYCWSSDKGEHDRVRRMPHSAVRELLHGRAVTVQERHEKSLVQTCLGVVANRAKYWVTGRLLQQMVDLRPGARREVLPGGHSLFARGVTASKSMQAAVDSGICQCR